MPNPTRSRPSPAPPAPTRRSPQRPAKRPYPAHHKSPPSAGFIDRPAVYRRGAALHDRRGALMPPKPHIPLFDAHEFPEVQRVVDARVEILRQRNEQAEHDLEGTLFLPGI